MVASGLFTLIKFCKRSGAQYCARRQAETASNEPFFIVSYAYLLFFKTNLMVESISKWSGEQNCARGQHNGNHWTTTISGLNDANKSLTGLALQSSRSL